MRWTNSSPATCRCCRDDEALADAELLGARREARATLLRASARALAVAAGQPRRAATPAPVARSLDAPDPDRETVFHCAAATQPARVLEARSARASCTSIFTGREYQPHAASACDRIHQQVLKSRVFVALHMHAGDGNVHTNIPVNSDDYAMLQAANAAVARIMRWPPIWAG